MRSMTAEFGGLTLELAATFGAARDIAKQVADPLAIAREAALEAMIPGYNPKFAFTVDNVPLIISIGAKAAGEKATLAQIQEAVFDAGFLAGKGIASDYLALIVTPRNQETPDNVDEGKDQPGE